MLPVLCYGDICADLLIPYGQALKARYEVISSETTAVSFSHGGSVANTAVALSRLQIPTMFLGTAGYDAFGKALKRGLDNDNVDTSLLLLKENVMTTLVLLIIDEKGERVPFAYPKYGASQHLITKEQIPADLITRISLMHSSGMTLREEPAASNQLSLMRSCHESGIPVSLDINVRLESNHNKTFSENIHKALQYVDILFGSFEDELCPLAGETEPDKVSNKLLEIVPMVIARQGEKGAIVYTRTNSFCCSAFSVPIRDRIGAGDVYDGAFLASILASYSVKDANRRACAAGAWCVSHYGGRSGPNEAEIQSILSSKKELH